MTFIDTRTSGISSYSRDVTSLNRTSDIKSGIIKLNNRSIRINAGDTLQTIVSKINRCSSFTGVRASVATERGRQIIALSSSGQITIVDSNNILNNIGVRIRSNQLQSRQLLYGLVLTELAATKSSSNRYGNYGNAEPAQIREIEDNKLVSLPQKDDQEFFTINLGEFFNEEAERIELFEESDVESSDSGDLSDGGTKYYSASPIKQKELDDDANSDAADPQRKDSIAIGEKYKKSQEHELTKKQIKQMLANVDKVVKKNIKAEKQKENDFVKINIQHNKKKLPSKSDPISPLKHGTYKDFNTMSTCLLQLPNIDKIAERYGLSRRTIKELTFMDIKELVARNSLFTVLRENKDTTQKAQIEIIEKFCKDNQQHKITRLFKDHNQILKEAKYPKTYDHIAKMINFYKLCYEHLNLVRDPKDEHYVKYILSATPSSYKLGASAFK